MSDRCPYINAVDFNDFYCLSHILRYHTENTSRRQSVAEHSYRVAMIAVKFLYLYDTFMSKNEDSITLFNIKELELEIFRHAMMHDIEEQNGDIPSDLKRIIRERSNIDVNDIMFKLYWTPRGIDKKHPVNPIVDALVSLADTFEGNLIATTIPVENGREFSGIGVRSSVLRSWHDIWMVKVKKFGPVLDEGFCYLLTNDYFNNRLIVDKAWV